MPFDTVNKLWNGAQGVGWRERGARLPLARNYDLLLALFVAAVIALFVLPLPTVVLDGLISLNLALSILLLTVSTYLPSAVSFSSFPALLLFTTLLRLALNIASCKLILLQANAGHVIDTFGRLIVGNNFVVGGVVFLVIAIVQFIVIAKGSERVAEVGARFSLDAMPGKQMSIDADLRAGIITSDEAKRRRELLEQESQLHGAMDGAMKFVKGDAIAGIIIAFINILAGIAVGTLMHDMSVSQALHRYAVLTVGDGMASQIPSLLVSIAAGVVTTRVASRDAQERHLGEQIGTQIANHPRAILIAGVIVLAFVPVSGFPKWSFLLLAGSMISGGVFLMRRRKTIPALNLITLADAPADSEGGLGAGGSQVHPLGMTALLAVVFARDLRAHLNLVQLQAALSDAKARVDVDLGPVFPRMNLRFDPALAQHSYRILLQDVIASTGYLRPGLLLWDGGSPLPADLGREAGEPFGPFTQPVWLGSHTPPTRGAATQTGNSGKLTHEQVLAQHLESIVRANPAALIGIQETQALVHLARRDHPELIAELTRLVPLQRITEVLRRLLLEHIPIRNLRVIFESLITWAPKEPDDTIALVEQVRVDLKRMITDRYCGVSRSLDVVLFEQSLQDRVQAAITKTPQGVFLGLAREVKDNVGEQTRAVMESLRSAARDGRERRVGVLVPMAVRFYVKSMIEPVLPDVPVLSYQEIEEDVRLHTIGWVKNPA
jgi:type III secretion protein V